ncbi:pleckstrin domain-containing protein [Cavenderia fasciculata]|uniref:Pleckstrin domain-containing protein n=1 Tax=Cavenderia fasciculata TaxID=261658 RepID=F4QF72_CACFS|nr:pleckstrin domain-containing protein [Cavenderia fasciculata]EGG14226.1 pleckstrin domain-containing protein [Cavenderia fasciculata]|eukprot:XP_004350935.1 pleckstrin domain-containing protein [Cavenderia fasciculata]
MGNNSSKSNSTYNEDESTKRKREQILDEIISTEKTYVNYLCVIEEVYLEPMRKQKITSTENIEAIFSTVDQIVSFHRDFFTELASTYNTFSWISSTVTPPTRVTTVTTSNSTTITTTTTTTISPKQKITNTFEAILAILDVFNKHRSNFKIYSSYIVAYDNAISTLNRLKKKSSFNNFIEKCRTDSRSNGQDINSLIIMPVQRLPRYVLLLNELLKNVPNLNIYSNITKSLESCIGGVKNVTQFVNDAKKDDDMMARLKELQDALLDKVNMNEPGRRLVMEGQVTIHSTYPLKEKDELLKRIRKYRKQKKADTQQENIVFPEEFKTPNNIINYCIFNDCLVFLNKPPKSSISNFINSSKIYSIVDCSIYDQVKAFDVLDIFGYKNGIIIFTEKLCYFINLPTLNEKDRLLETLAMSKNLPPIPVTKETLAAALASSSNLPGLLTVRERSATTTTPAIKEKENTTQHKSSLSFISSSSSSSSSSSTTSKASSKSFILSKSTSSASAKEKNNEKDKTQGTIGPRKSLFFKDKD